MIVFVETGRRVMSELINLSAVTRIVYCSDLGHVDVHFAGGTCTSLQPEEADAFLERLEELSRQRGPILMIAAPAQPGGNANVRTQTQQHGGPAQPAGQGDAGPGPQPIAVGAVRKRAPRRNPAAPARAAG